MLNNCYVAGIILDILHIMSTLIGGNISVFIFVKHT